MDLERLEKLTERQRECLRMVLNHYSSKEMARALGIGVDAVDQRLKSAMRKLGVNSRFEAARMLASHEGNGLRSGVPEKEPKDRMPPVSRRGPGIVKGLGSFFRRAKKILPRAKRNRFVFWAFLGSLLLGLIDLGVPIDFFLRDRQVAAHPRPASGSIILVLIDKKSVVAWGGPGDRRHIAQIFRELDRLGASTIVSGIYLDRRADPAEDRELAKVLQGLGARAVLSIGVEYDAQSGKPVWSLPLPEFRKRAVIGQISFLGVLSIARRVPHKITLDRTFGSAITELANVSPPEGSWWSRLFGHRINSFQIDYTIDPRTIPAVSAADLLAGKVPPGLVKGSNVLLARSHPRTHNPIPGNRDVSDGYVAAIAAETLIRGVPSQLPWPLPLVAALLIIVACAPARSAVISILLLGGSMAGLLLLPSVLFRNNIYIDVSPALLLLMLVGSHFSWAFVRSRWLSVPQ